MFSLYRSLLRFRAGSPALRRGDFRAVDTSAEVFAFERAAGDDRLVIALNFAPNPTQISLGARDPGGRIFLSTDPDRILGSTPLRSLRLGPLEGVIVRPGPS